MSEQPVRKPEWIRVKFTADEANRKVAGMLRDLNLHTVCEEADCPNCGECFHKKTATFMILGKNCTRSCTFCTVTKAPPQAVDPDEPGHIAQAVRMLGLRHVVVTSVTRDDLPDGGAAHFADVIRAIRLDTEVNPVIEVLIPDFRGDPEALMTVLRAGPDILNHNVETVPRLYGEVRPQAVYGRSIELLRLAKETAPRITTKSGIMLGLGETREEVLGVMRDLREAGCGILTIGQYLAPSKQHHPVVEYIHPDVFADYKNVGADIGFLYVASGPLIRSSYMAAEVFEEIRANRQKEEIK